MMQHCLKGDDYTISFLKNRQSYPDELEVWQVAKILNCSMPHVYKLLQDRQLLYYRIGKKYYIPTDDLVRFLESKKVPAKE